MKYTVKVVREDDQWLAEVVELEGTQTYAGNLVALDANVREAIALVEDLAEGAEAGLDLKYEYHGVDPEFVTAARLGELRTVLDTATKELAQLSDSAARELQAAGWSVRDISHALNLSPGRVSQMVGPSRGDQERVLWAWREVADRVSNRGWQIERIMHISPIDDSTVIVDAQGRRVEDVLHQHAAARDT